MIPRSLEIEVHCDQQEYPLRNGGFADVWKCPYDGKEVAVKVLKVYQTSNFEQIRRVGCSRPVCINGLTISRIEILQGGYDVERPSSSKRVATAWSDDDR